MKGTAMVTIIYDRPRLMKVTFQLFVAVTIVLVLAIIVEIAEAAMARIESHAWPIGQP